MGEATKSYKVIPIEGLDPPKDRKSISRKHLVNRLNFINFQDRPITAHFSNGSLQRDFSVSVKPQPCNGEHLECLWEDPEAVLPHLDVFALKQISIDVGHRRIEFSPEESFIDETGLRLRLPETAQETAIQKKTQHRCKGISAQLIQHSVHFSGKLISFDARRFRISLEVRPPQTFGWINLENPVQIIFGRDGSILYTSECRIAEHNSKAGRGTFTLEPTEDRLRRFGTKEFRSERHRLVPTPYLVFRHPFTGTLIQREVVDLSGSGFSVDEDPTESMLLPGLILPSAELNFANTFQLTCKAQVVYRLQAGSETGEKNFRCGLAFLDIGIEDHTKLLALLNNVGNRHCYICNRVDLDALWDFFFESGFIYPEKYAFIQTNKDKIKQIYERLYNQASTIARHFTYQDGARILGHIAMVRFFTSAWLIHHHAGNTSASTRAGLEVLNRIGHFTYECHRFHCLHMDYLLCYFRPDNKFPSRVFGRITQNIDNTQGSSIDCFAYCHYRQHPVDGFALPDGWELEQSEIEDLELLRRFYEPHSGGLMLEALDLTPEALDISDLKKEYTRLGFRRDRYVLSLRNRGETRVVIAANVADVGLNLSDLTSAVNVFFIHPKPPSKEILDRTLHLVAEFYHMDEIPVLLFPAETAEALTCPIEKYYNLWILNTDFSDHYFRHLNRLLRFVQ
ncbi:MAG: hypothetical protein PVG78_07495 [Desulfobacterales bacterium]|jgi:hypothetical protein